VKTSSSRVPRSVVEKRRRRVISLVESLPEAAATPGGENHLSLGVRGKRFGYFLDHHHGDGRVALNCKTAPGVNQRLVDVAPARFFIPKYVGHRGWLDLPRVDWEEIEDIITEAYRLTAPRKLLLK